MSTRDEFNPVFSPDSVAVSPYPDQSLGLGCVVSHPPSPIEPLVQVVWQSLSNSTHGLVSVAWESRQFGPSPAPASVTVSPHPDPSLGLGCVPVTSSPIV